jgi:hypothetical protein
MNTDRLARHYEKLAPKERFLLIVAAAARNDEEERQRLVQSAPPVRYRVGHHWGVASSFEFLANFHFMELVEIAAYYLELLARVANHRPKKGDDSFDEWHDGMLLGGYLFKTRWVGWRSFCADFNLDPDIHWSILPGFQLLKRAERASGTNPKTGLPGLAFVEEEEVARYLAPTPLKIASAR